MATRCKEKFVFPEQCGWSHGLNRHAKIVLRETLRGTTRVEYKRMLNYLITQSNSINLLAQQTHCRSTPLAQSRFKALKTPMLATVIAKFNASNLQRNTAWVKATLTQLSYGSNLVTSPPINSLISLSTSCSGTSSLWLNAASLWHRCRQPITFVKRCNAALPCIVNSIPQLNIEHFFLVQVANFV